MSFDKDMQDFTTLVEKLHSRQSVEVAKGIAQEIVDATPIDSGRLKANWTGSLNRREATYSRRVRDRGGYATITEAIRPLDRYKPGDVFYLANAAPYAATVAEGGWSDQQPRAGWIKRAMNRGRRKALRRMQEG